MFDHLHSVAFRRASFASFSYLLYTHSSSFVDQPLSRTILGTNANILAIKRDDLDSYINLKIASGSQDGTIPNAPPVTCFSLVLEVLIELVNLAEKHFSSLPVS
jgi:hypothetical protein